MADAAGTRNPSISATGRTGSLLRSGLEETSSLFRLDRRVEPAAFRGPILSQPEMAGLRQIERVVRLGHVRHLGADRIVLDEGEIPTNRSELHVDCTASGFRWAPARPIFEPGDAIFFDELFLHQTGSDPAMPRPRYAVENWFFGGSSFPAEYAPVAV